MLSSHVLAIHIDGGARVGLGHATRCIGLAEACKMLGFLVYFLIDPALELDDFLIRHGQTIQPCGGNPSSLLQTAKALGAEALVIDSYRLDGAAVRSLTQQNIPIICFDDQANRPLPVDMVINGSPAAPTFFYEVRPDTRLLLDVAYQVVRPEFLAEVPRDYERPVRSLFISIGGSDLLGIFDSLLAFLSTSDPQGLADIALNFVVGPFARTGDRPLPRNLHLHHSPPDMRSLMATADLAISAGGQTLYELARCGTPTIAFCVGADQIPNLTSLEKRGCIVNTGWANHPNWLQHLDQTLQTLVNDAHQRQVLGAAACNLIDGKGAIRIAQEIQALINP